MTTDLPFERGSTYFESNPFALAESTIASVAHLLGRTFTVESNHEGGTDTEIMIVHNGTGLVIPKSIGLSFDNNPYDATAGAGVNAYGFVSDDEMNIDVPVNDLLYVVTKGLCYTLVQFAGTFSNGDPIKFTSAGQVGPAAGTGHVIGVAHGTQTVSTSGPLLANLGHPAAIGPT